MERCWRHLPVPLLLACTLAAAAQEHAPSSGAMPTFRFDPPAGFNRVGGDLFTPNTLHHASVKIQFFRPFQGKLDEEVGTSLMREWQRELNRPVRLLAQPQREKSPVQGADAAIATVFAEDYNG